MTVETRPTITAPSRGSVLQGTALGLATVLGGHAVMWAVLPSLQPAPAAAAFFIAPWLTLIALVVHFLRRRQPRTAGRLGIAAAIVLGIVLLAAGAIVVIFSRGALH